MRRFKIGRCQCPASGVEFFVEDDATQEEIDKASFEAAVEYLDFGFDEVTSSGGCDEDLDV